MSLLANWNVRTGVSLRKRYKSIASQKKDRYKCDLCGKVAVRRVGAGIWKCHYCDAVFAGGAYTPKTAAGELTSKALGAAK